MLPASLIERYGLNDRPSSLLSTNPKIEKGLGEGWLTMGLHLAPHRFSGFNVCANASEGCIAACLNFAGRGKIALDENGLNVAQVARIRRTRFLKLHRREFFAQLVREIKAGRRKAAREQLRLAIRLNVASDERWERYVVQDGKTIFELFPDVIFYDYTKHPLRKRRTFPNYSLTFSLSEENDADAAEALRAGVNVAVAFDRRPGTKRRAGEPLPKTFTIHGVRRPVIDGDVTDLRFTDPTGVIVGLRAKQSTGLETGKAAGFIRQAA